MADLKNDIEKYLRGELTPAEMHAMEKKALEDSFLADALEGAETVNRENFADDVKNLEGLLQDRIHLNHTIPMWLLFSRIAAGLLVLLVTGYIIFSVVGGKKKSLSLALNEPTFTLPQEDVKTDSVTKNFMSDKSEDIKTASPAPSKQQPVSSLPEEEQTAGPSIQNEPPAPEIVMLDKTEEVQSDNAKTPLPEAGFELKDNNAQPVQKKMERATSGLVSSSTIKSKQEKRMAKGSVNHLDQTDAKTEDNAPQRNEVVTGNNSPGDESDKEKASVSHQFAEPVGGREAFKKYLEDNMQYPEQALKNKIEGEVTVQFAVERNGQVNDFKVLKSIGYGCDEEVIRLVKQGPKWVPASQKEMVLNENVNVSLRFVLPD